jgi:hypothetical protein
MNYYNALARRAIFQHRNRPRYILNCCTTAKLKANPDRSSFILEASFSFINLLYFGPPLVPRLPSRSASPILKFPFHRANYFSMAQPSRLGIHRFTRRRIAVSVSFVRGRTEIQIQIQLARSTKQVQAIPPEQDLDTVHTATRSGWSAPALCR